MAGKNNTSGEISQMNDKIDWLKENLTNHINKEDQNVEKLIGLMTEMRDSFKEELSKEISRLDSSKADKKVETIMWWILGGLFAGMFSTITYNILNHIGLN